MVICVIAA